MSVQKKILVIDDETIWHGLLKKFFGQLGYAVHAAASCAEGIRLAAELRPDCIVLDFHLRDGDAVEVCEAIRGNGSINRTPILIFSSDEEAEIEAYCLCRADGFLYKGEDAISALRKAIENVLPRDLPEPTEL